MTPETDVTWIKGRPITDETMSLVMAAKARLANGSTLPIELKRRLAEAEVDVAALIRSVRH